MLVLTRKPGQVIFIGELIQVKLICVEPDVRLGIVAPDDVAIFREEIYAPGQPALSQPSPRFVRQTPPAVAMSRLERVLDPRD